MRALREVSDLIGVAVTLALIAWFVGVLLAFFFVGPFVGILVIAVGLLLAGSAAVKLIGSNDG